MSDDLSFLLSSEPLPQSVPDSVRASQPAQTASPERLKFLWAEARRLVVIKAKPPEPAQAQSDVAPLARPLSLKEQLKEWSK